MPRQKSNAVSSPGEERYRRKQLRKEFMELFRRGAEGDEVARAILVERWPTLQEVTDDLILEYSRHYLEAFRATAIWVCTENFRKLVETKTKAKPPVDDELQIALSAKPTTREPEEQVRRTNSIVATRRPAARPTKHRAKRPTLAASPARSFVDVTDALMVHTRLVADFAFSADPIEPPGVRNMNLLASAIARQETSLGETRKYETLCEVAASLLYGMILDHPFHNGNKRTGLVTMLQLLDRNNFYLDVSEAELFTTLVSIADHKFASGDADTEVFAIAEWIASHLARLDRREYPLSLRDLVSKLKRFGCTVGDFDAGHISVYRSGYPRKRLSFHVFGEEVNPAEVHEIRKELGLDEDHGITSRVFYGSDEPVDVWINHYRRLLRDLAKV